MHDTTTCRTEPTFAPRFDYIEAFDNPNRIQRRLGHQSPTDYEHSAG
jgi:hypothetical protein